MSVDSVVSSCYNMGSVEGNSMVGGIVGILSGIVENCYNIGKVKSNATMVYKAAGGIAGGILHDTIIKNCYNDGEIYSGSDGGGIVGNGGRSSHILKIVNCYNLNKISAVSGAGGIAGRVGTVSGSKIEDIEIINCYNIGSINGESHSSGIVAAVLANNGETYVNFSNVLNVGKVAQDSKFVGEIIAQEGKTQSCVLNNCFYSNSSTNKGVGFGGSTITGETTATSIDSSLITTLNEYVASYNEANINNEDFVELKLWKLDGQTVKFK